MGWTNSHLHQFVAQRQRFFDPRSRVKSKVANENGTRLGELIWTVGARLLYEYDFGDGWRHTSFCWKKCCSEMNHFSRCAWRENDVVRRKTAEGRRGLLSFSKRWPMPITSDHAGRSVHGSVILLLNRSPKKRSTGDYVGGSMEHDEQRNRNECSCLFWPTVIAIRHRQERTTPLCRCQQ